MDDHICIPGESDDNCAECGKPLPDAGETPDLGDIVGISLLLDRTAESCAKAVRENTDPKDPSQPRLRFIGNRLFRSPHSAAVQKVLQPSYKEAKALGYLGTFERWGELVLERKHPPESPLPR